MFNIGPKQVRVGVVKFASHPTLEFRLNEYNDRASLERAVDSILQIGGGTQTGQALSFMSPYFKETETTRGTKVQEILIVITDGKSQDEVKEPAEQLRAQGVTIYAIGVKDANEQELLEIAADPKRMYFVTNFDALKPLKNEIVTDICSDEGMCVKCTFNHIFKKQEQKKTLVIFYAFLDYVDYRVFLFLSSLQKHVGRYNLFG